MKQPSPWWVSGLMACVPIYSLSATASQLSLGIDPNETVVVTAQRMPQTIDDTLARVSVITREDIERAQARDIKELLQTQAGLDLARTGGPGGQTSVFMRGANSNHVLVLIDGIRVSAAGTGAFQWELVDLATVERIEIVRGPRAARWGSDAIGGVIQIFTRQVQGISLQGQLGSYGERGAAVGVGRGTHSLIGAVRRTEGFSSQNAGGFAYDPDDDGFNQQQLAGQGRLDLEVGTLSWSGRWLTGELEFDQGLSESEQYAGHIGYSAAWGLWSIDTEAGIYRDRLETTTAFGFSKNITRRTQMSVVASRQWESMNWSIGWDGWRESGVNVGTWREQRNHWGTWMGLDGQFNMLSYSVSLRLDDDERYGQETTGQLGLGWDLSDEVRSFISIGQGFRSPNFSQLFSPGFGGLFAGNPALAPETSDSFEWGLDWTPMLGHSFAVSAFYSSIEDLINFSGPNFQAININEAQIKGIEFQHQFTSPRWQSQLQWTWQQPEDKALNQPLLRRAKSKGSWVLSYSIDDHQLGAEVLYIGQRVDVGQVALSPYTLINLTARWQINQTLSMEGRLENLAGADYEPLVGFNAPGRSVLLGLTWTPAL